MKSKEVMKKVYLPNHLIIRHVRVPEISGSRAGTKKRKKRHNCLLPKETDPVEFPLPYSPEVIRLLARYRVTYTILLNTYPTFIHARDRRIVSPSRRDAVG